MHEDQRRSCPLGLPRASASAAAPRTLGAALPDLALEELSRQVRIAQRRLVAGVEPVAQPALPALVLVSLGLGAMLLEAASAHEVGRDQAAEERVGDGVCRESSAVTNSERNRGT